jgi:predicted alpha/beta hydrolase family esterase
MTTTTTPRFLFLHGWENFRPEAHWQHITVTALRSRGFAVEYPQLPSANEPTVAAWSAAADAALTRLATPDAADRASATPEIVVVCHSLSAALWLGARPGTVPVSRVLLVAPPAPEVLVSHPAIAEFGELLATRIASGRTPDTASAGDSITIVGSDNDPFCPDGAAVTFGEGLGISTIVVPGGGHLEITAGYGRWPSLLEWCIDPSAAIVGAHTQHEEISGDAAR